MASTLGDRIQESEMVSVSRHSIGSDLPAEITPPLSFREPGQPFEGNVGHPRDLVKMFEPIDVLDGATELVDQRGAMITIECDDLQVKERNEYPKSYDGVYYRVHS